MDVPIDPALIHGVEERGLRSGGGATVIAEKRSVVRPGLCQIQRLIVTAAGCPRRKTWQRRISHRDACRPGTRRRSRTVKVGNRNIPAQSAEVCNHLQGMTDIIVNNRPGSRTCSAHRFWPKGDVVGERSGLDGH